MAKARKKPISPAQLRNQVRRLATNLDALIGPLEASAEQERLRLDGVEVLHFLCESRRHLGQALAMYLDGQSKLGWQAET